MTAISKSSKTLAIIAALTLPVTGSVYAQEIAPQDGQDGEVLTTVTGTTPSDLSGMPDGPTVEGVISALAVHPPH